MAKYQDKTVIVTGAGSGIGFALCQAFAGAGAQVALNDIDAALTEQAAGVINSAIGAERVYPYALDVADVRRVREMVDDVAERTGRLDIVIANAGITNYGLFLEYSVEALDRLTGVNIRGTFFTAQAALAR
jgi:NAD(P)-dependent dehydrogenase (short-subunit alcohol dehydrogenase family)